MLEVGKPGRRRPERVSGATPQLDRSRHGEEGRYNGDQSRLLEFQNQQTSAGESGRVWWRNENPVPLLPELLREYGQTAGGGFFLRANSAKMFCWVWEVSTTTTGGGKGRGSDESDEQSVLGC